MVYRERGRVMSAQTAYAPTLWHEMFATVFNEIINRVLVTMWVGWLATERTKVLDLPPLLAEACELTWRRAFGSRPEAFAQFLRHFAL